MSRLPDEPSWTCPDIDQVKESISELIKQLHRAKNQEYTEDEANYFIEDIAYQLSTIYDEMEDVRKSNKNLRSWGQAYKDAYDEMESDNEEYKDQIDKMEDEIYELKDRIDKLERDNEQLISEKVELEDRLNEVG